MDILSSGICREFTFKPSGMFSKSSLPASVIQAAKDRGAVYKQSPLCEKDNNFRKTSIPYLLNTYESVHWGKYGG
ncbi:hypothetical protein XELAEV_18002175mg [Xenopus laevis]|uniref:Uncharacterized protein n=1 Tax=Xenopus laevis TaxID=8355 RepID=A0A974BNL5_XENLA|nr:hypothetical protein XELAEV_18002175mg [Xenopus laevis]